MPITEDLGPQIDGVGALFITGPRAPATSTVYYDAAPVVGVVEIDEVTVLLPFIPATPGHTLVIVYTAAPVLGGYCTVQDVRDEGYTDTVKYTDARITRQIQLASRYIDKMTGRWFEPREFGLSTPPGSWPLPIQLVPGTDYAVPSQATLLPGDTPYVVNGNGRRELELVIPIIRLDALGIENQAFLYAQLTWIHLSAIRIYNRHLTGQTQPDDRENPVMGFTVAGRIVETVASGLYPAPRIFPHGRKNVYLFGCFGYTDPDPTGAEPRGITPSLIKQVCVLLAIRDLLPESDAAEKLAFKNKYRIISDSETGSGGTQSVSLQQAWLRGAFTGDPEIDNVLMAYKRPPRIGVV